MVKSLEQPLQENWKVVDINVDSLWFYGERDKTGKHTNVYHGNFIPQIPNQLIRRYSSEHDVILDIFMGSGTTLYECEKLNRQFIGFDINSEIIGYVNSKMTESNMKYIINNCDVTNDILFSQNIAQSLKTINREKVQFMIAHPPYMDAVIIG